MYNFSFDFSPFKRCTFWGLIVGSFIGQLTIYGSSQTMLQRYMSISSVRKSQLYVTSGFCRSLANVPLNLFNFKDQWNFLIFLNNDANIRMIFSFVLFLLDKKRNWIETLILNEYSLLVFINNTYNYFFFQCPLCKLAHDNTTHNISVYRWPRHIRHLPRMWSFNWRKNHFKGPGI